MDRTLAAPRVPASDALKAGLMVSRTVAVRAERRAEPKGAMSVS